jgi:ATP synthase protein I
VLLGPRRGKQLNALTRLASVGIEFSLSTIVGLLGGRWLDAKLGSAPWLMIVGLLLGVVAGFRSLLRAARKATEDSEARDVNDVKSNEHADD